MRITPLMTEKSMTEAKDGRYSFWVPTSLTKNQIKTQIGEIFGVSVVSVRTINYKRLTKRNIRGKKQVVKARKKAVVTLSGKDKIDLFEEKTK